MYNNNFIHNKEFVKIPGKVIGNFYDEDGNPTTALKEFKEGLKQAKKAKSQDEDDLRKYPSCNSEWSQASGSRVWCSDKRFLISQLSSQAGLLYFLHQLFQFDQWRIHWEFNPPPPRSIFFFACRCEN